MGKSKKRQLRPIREYLNDKGELIEQMFASIPIVEVKNMVPINLQGMPLHELKAECLVELLAMSNGEVLSILEGKKRRTVTSSDSEESLVVMSDEEVSFKKKETKIACRGKAQHSDRSSPEPSHKEKKKKKRKSEEIELKNRKKKKGNEPSLPSTTKNVVSVKESPSKKKSADKVSKDRTEDKRKEKPEDDDVVIVEDDEIEGRAAKKEEKSLLDLLELEMRARAIKALLKTEDDIEKRKRLEEYRDEPDDIIPVVEELPQIELLSDSDDEATKERREIAENIRIQVDGDSLSMQDAEVLDSLLGIGKEKVNPAESIDISDDTSTDGFEKNLIPSRENQHCGEFGAESDIIVGSTERVEHECLKADGTENFVEMGKDTPGDGCEVQPGSRQEVKSSQEIPIIEHALHGLRKESPSEVGQIAVSEPLEQKKSNDTSQIYENPTQLSDPAELKCVPARADIAECDNFLATSSNVSRDVTTDRTNQMDVLTIEMVSKKEDGEPQFEEEFLDYDYDIMSTSKQTPALIVYADSPACQTHAPNDTCGSSGSTVVGENADETVIPSGNALVENTCSEKETVITEEDCYENILQLAKEDPVQVQNEQLITSELDSGERPCSAADGQSLLSHQSVKSGITKSDQLTKDKLSLSDGHSSKQSSETNFAVQSNKSKQVMVASCNELTDVKLAKQNIVEVSSFLEVVTSTQDEEDQSLTKEPDENAPLAKTDEPVSRCSSNEKDLSMLLTDNRHLATENSHSSQGLPGTMRTDCSWLIGVEFEQTGTGSNEIAKENDIKGVDVEKGVFSEAMICHEPAFVRDSIGYAVISCHTENQGLSKAVADNFRNDLEIASTEGNLSPQDVEPTSDDTETLPNVAEDLCSKSHVGNKADGERVSHFGCVADECLRAKVVAPKQPSCSMVLAANIEKRLALSQPALCANFINEANQHCGKEVIDVAADLPKTNDEPCFQEEASVQAKSGVTCITLVDLQQQSHPLVQKAPENSVNSELATPAVVLGSLRYTKNSELVTNTSNFEGSPHLIETPETVPSCNLVPALELNTELADIVEVHCDEAERHIGNCNQNEIIEISSPTCDGNDKDVENQEIVFTVNSDSSEGESSEEGEINSGESVVEVQSSGDEPENSIASAVQKKSLKLKRKSLGNHQTIELLESETITIEDDDVVNTLVQQVPIEFLELDDSDEEKSSWTARWLESDNVKKVVKTSKMLMNLRKKLMSLKKSKITQQAEESELPPAVQSTPKLIGSVEEYHKLVRDGVITGSKASDGEWRSKAVEALDILNSSPKIVAALETVKSSAKTVEASGTVKSSAKSVEASEILKNCAKSVRELKTLNSSAEASKDCLGSESATGLSSASAVKDNNEAKPQRMTDAPQKTTSFHDSAFEDISDAEEKEDGELSDSDEGLLAGQQDSFKSAAKTCDNVPTVHQIPVPPTEERVPQRTGGSVKVIHPTNISNKGKPQKKKKPRRSRKDIQKIYKSLGPRAFKVGKTPPAKNLAFKKKNSKKSWHPGLGAAPGVVGAVSNTATLAYGVPAMPSAVNSMPVNPAQAEVSNLYPYRVAAASQMSTSNATMHSTYQAWLYSQGNYGYGTPEAAAQDPSVYKQWEEYYRSLMEACRASAAHFGATKGYDWVFDPSKLVTSLPQNSDPSSQPATTSLPDIPVENLPAPVTSGNSNYHYRYGLKGLLKEHFTGSNILGQSSDASKNT